MVVSKMQCLRLFGRAVNISVLREQAVLQRKLFTTEGSGNGNEMLCSTAGDREQDKVMKLKDLNADSSCEYID
jgi:hypothetical protein